MNDRGIIKWQPFDSVFSSSILKKEVLNNKSKINKPILSDEQKLNIEDDIIKAYHENIIINITYFRSNKLYKIAKKIIKIIFINQKIIFEDNTYIYFDQIIKTSI